MSSASDSEDGPPMPKIVISRITSPSDLLALALIDEAAFATSPIVQLLATHPISPSSPETTDNSSPTTSPSIPDRLRATHTELLTFLTNPLTTIVAARIPSQDNAIIGFARWHFLPNPSIASPSASSIHPSSYHAFKNPEFAEKFFEAIKWDRENFMKDEEEYGYLAVLAVLPEWQRKGVGGRLLRWGMWESNKRQEGRGVKCWLDASKEGKGLYVKNGWMQVGSWDFRIKEREDGVEGEVEGVVPHLVRGVHGDRGRV